MREYRSSLIRILQYQKRIVNSVLIRKDMGLRKPEIWHFYAIDMIWNFWNQSEISFFHKVCWIVNSGIFFLYVESHQKHTNADLKIWQYLRLHMKKNVLRFYINARSTFWDTRTSDIWKVCLQTFRSNRIR